MLLFGVCVSKAGNIRGHVEAQGKEGAGADGDGGKYGSRKLKFVERVNCSTFEDFVVYIEGSVGGAPANAPEQPEKVSTVRGTVRQEGAQFSPHVLPVVAGTTVEGPNNDRIYHNVFWCRARNSPASASSWPALPMN